MKQGYCKDLENLVLVYVHKDQIENEDLSEIIKVLKVFINISGIDYHGNEDVGKQEDLNY